VWGRTNTGEGVSRDRHTFAIENVRHLQCGGSAYVITCDAEPYLVEYVAPACDVTLIEDESNHRFGGDATCNICGRTPRHER
jgi:hypothetical protein